MFGLHRRSSKEKPPRHSVSQTPSKYPLNNFDEFVSVQEKPNQRCREHSRPSRDVADPKRRLLQFDVQEFCSNFEKGMMKALKDINQVHRKSISTRAPVAEPSLFISEKPKGKSETHVEEFKDFSDSLPIFDEPNEEPIESLFSCEKNCDLRSIEPEFILDNEQTIVELTVLQPEHPSSLVLSPQVFEEEPLDYPHQGPRLDSRELLDDDLGPIFDEGDDLDPILDEETTSITSIAMESHLCFDPGPLSPTPLSPDLQKHCEKSDLINSLPDMFVKISSHDPDLVCSDSDHVRHVLKMFYGVSCLESILIYNTFFDKHVELWISKMDLRTNPFEEGEYDRTKIEHRPFWFMDTVQGGDLVDQLDLAEVFSSDYANSLIIYAILDELNTQVSWTDTIMDELSKLVQSPELVRPSNHPRRNTDIRSLFEAYLLNHDVSSRKTTWRMCLTQLRSSSTKNQIKRSSDVEVMQFTNQVIFSSREFGLCGSSGVHPNHSHHGPAQPA
ncbi:hypothetical protein Rs2_38960 [Raphanus sativus]|nr:hypothetical protein Rs2_38960 [Raphanus sativus]